MARKVLGQINPSANVTNTVYTCSATSFIATVYVCNMDPTPAQVRVGICRAGAAAVDGLILFDLNLDGNWFGCVSTGICGKTGDNITIRATTANVAFSALGDEV